MTMTTTTTTTTTTTGSAQRARLSREALIARALVAADVAPHVGAIERIVTTDPKQLDGDRLLTLWVALSCESGSLARQGYGPVDGRFARAARELSWWRQRS